MMTGGYEPLTERLARARKEQPWPWPDADRLRAMREEAEAAHERRLASGLNLRLSERRAISALRRGVQPHAGLDGLVWRLVKRGVLAFDAGGAVVQTTFGEKVPA